MDRILRIVPGWTKSFISSQFQNKKRWHTVSAILLIVLAVSSHLFSPVSAAPTSTIVYSTDGGVTWSSSPTAKSGQEVITRLYFNNDGLSNVNDAQMSTTLPAGFNLIAGSTRTCLNPGTTDPTNPTTEMVCNNTAGQGGAINEAAVWSGNSLAIAPNAGVYGVATNSTSGLLAAGKKRYVNLHQCIRQTNPAYDYITMIIDDPIASTWSAGTNASNTADSIFNCNDISGSGWTTHSTISAVQNLDLLGKRYVNLHQCPHYFPDAAQGNRWIPRLVNSPGATNWGTGTNTSNTADGTVSCVEPGGGWTYWAPLAGVQALDTLNSRYLNLHECVRIQASPSAWVSLFIANPASSDWATGTGASNTPSSVVDCSAAVNWTTHSTLSDFQVLDTLDTARGQGFVEYKMQAPDVTTSQVLDQDATLTGTGTGNPTSNASITVEADLQLVYSTDGGTTWTTTPQVESGANIKVRVFSHNKHIETLTNTQFATTLPSGFSLVPGSTKICLNPGTTDPTNPATEMVCNNTAGQGGAINEGTVWSGSNLAISPTAGLFGQPTDATSGYLAAGKKKYVNLHQCNRHYNPSYHWITVAIDDPIASTWYAGTDALNTADGAVDCGPSSWVNYPAISGVQNIDLFGKRYVNLHQCLRYYSDANSVRYMTTLINNPPTAGWNANTNSSNTASSAVSCGVPGTWTQHTTLSDFQVLNILQNRYINIHQCLQTSSYYLTTFIADPPAAGWGTGTSATNTPDTSLECPVISGYSLHSSLSDFQVLDLLDTSRGQVFVEFEVTAPSPQIQAEYPQTAELTGTGTGDQTAEDTITVLVDPGVIITETSGSTSVTEGGSNDTIQIQLTAPPAQDVTINFTHDNGQLVAITSITFTPSNWDTPQSVSIIANDDATVEGPHSDSINFSTASVDAGFNGLTGDNIVSVNITDDDTPGAIVTVNNDITSEDGATGEFCIELFSQPNANVTIALSSSNTNEATVPASITILAANWNNPSANCVTVTGVDDGPVGDGVQTVTITTGDVTSADPDYNALDGSTIDNVTIYNQNNDPPGFAIDVIDATSGEDGSTATLRFRLLSQPLGGASVTIPLSVDDSTEGSLSGITEVIISNANWNNGAANEITVTGLNDNLTDGNIAYRLVTGDPASADPLYDALVAGDIVDPNFTNVDNDVAGVTITESGGSTDVTEGGASDTVQVVLNTQPAPGNIVVIDVQPQPQVNLGAGAGVAVQLTFTNGNWNTPQTITVNADNDTQLEANHSALVSYSIDSNATSESSYDSISGLVDTNVSIADNDTATVSITALDDAGENPADEGHFRVTVSNQNSTGGPITVSYSVGGTANASDYISLNGSVAIPNGATSADITISTAGKDDNLLEGSETVVITLTGTDNGLVSVDGANDDATLNVIDDETQTATASLQVSQQGSEAGPTSIIYQIVLSKQNETGSPIILSINPSGGSATAGDDYTDFSGQTITVPNGATTGTYTVTVADDGVAEGQEIVRAAISNPSLIGLTISTATANANLEDNDTTTVSITANDGAAAEDPADNGEFTVSLSAPNNATLPVTVTYIVSGSATAGADFTALSGQVQIPVGDSSATIIIDTSGFNDSIVEGNESVIVTLTGTDSSSVVLGTPVGAVVVITDSDTSPPAEPTSEPQPDTDEPQVGEDTVPNQSPTTDEEETQPTPQDDNDGVSSADEDKALNNGDGNGDSVSDKQQANVASLVSDVTNTPVTLAVAGDCKNIQDFGVSVEESVKDSDYTYPHGLFDFELSCGQNGQSATVTIYLDTTQNQNWIWRKFNRFGQVYATVGDHAQIGTAQVGDHTVTTVTYQITDGSDLDEDGAANGIILDPTGPGVQIANRSWTWWLLLPAVVVLWILRHRLQDNKQTTQKHIL